MEPTLFGKEQLREQRVRRKAGLLDWEQKGKERVGEPWVYREAAGPSFGRGGAGRQSRCSGDVDECTGGFDACGCA